MASNRQSPLWNQDAIMAAGLAFAGMAVLQSTLLPDSRVGTWRALCLEIFNRLAGSHLFHWWPVLLIVAGILVWILDARQQRPKQAVRSAVQTGGLK